MNGLTGSVKWEGEMFEGFWRKSSFIARWWPQCFLSRKKGIQTLAEEKEKDFYDVLLNKLISSVKNQKDFWESVHKISPKRKSFYNNISLDSCFKHFRALLEKEVDFDFYDENAVQDRESFLSRPVSKEEVDFDFYDENAVQDRESFLSRPVSKEEVMLAFRKLKNKKAAGPDGIKGEMLKNSANHEFFQLNGLTLSYFLCLRKARLIIRIITEVSHYVTQAAKFTVQLLTLDCKNGLK